MNAGLAKQISDLSQQALVSQDQYSSLYETVQDSVSRLVLLQAAAYEKSQAAKDFAVVNAEVALLKEETARLDSAKIDASSSELEHRVQQTTTEATNKILRNFEKENREWTLHQISVLEDRSSRQVAAKVIETETRLDQKVAAVQLAVDDVLLREAGAKKQAEAHNTLTLNAIRVTASKLELHEKQLDTVEDDVYSRVDAVRSRIDVLLEHCLGTSWSTLLNNISVTNSLLPIEARRVISESLSDDVFRRGQGRIRRHVDNIREWKRLQLLHSRFVDGVPDISRKLESSVEQVEASMLSKITQRRVDDTTTEQRRREDFDAHAALLKEYMSQVASVGPDSVDHGLQLHPAVETLRYVLSTPLFTHVRGSLSVEVKQSLALAREEFGQEYSNQLALVNKELRSKATLAGLEESVREFAQRSMTDFLASVQSRLDALQSSYVSQADLSDLLSAKADKLVVERKADDAEVQRLIAQLRCDVNDLNGATASNLTALLMSKFTDLTRDVSQQRAATTAARGGAATSNVTVTNASDKPPRIGAAPVAKKLSSDSAGSNDEVLQSKQEAIHAAQMRTSPMQSPASSAVELDDAREDGPPFMVIASIAPPHQITTETAAAAAPPFRVKDWADSVERRFGPHSSATKEKRAPRPPSAKR